ncbi:major facilitator superfamily domain-containing protein [Mariannaea sp. PMI_226]|nr:major facilitator superfamily domain-containing protein [Mariannaea sp. PMI_226]
MSATQLELEPVVHASEDHIPASSTAPIGTLTLQPAISAEPTAPSKTRSFALVATLTCAAFLNTFNSGTLTVALPSIAKQLNLPENLLLWPASVYALGLSCTLLLLGAIADIVGNRPIFLLGSTLYTGCTLAISRSQTGTQLIVFRALQGISMSFCMPTAVSIITSTFPTGKPRNFAFAVFGGGSPLGFATGLVLGGVFVQVSGWRTAYYVAAGVNAATTVLAWFTLPKTTPVENIKHQFIHGFDWVGVASANVCLALLSYILAELTYSGSVLKKAHNIVLLIVAVSLIPFFIFWVGRQERLGRPAIISNSMWKKREFSTVCLSVFLVWAWFNAFAYWATLFFQVTQELTALGAALRFLPLVIMGVATNIVAGFVMDKVSAGKLMLVGGLLSCVSPLLFAVQGSEWTYWAAGFPAMCLGVVSTDLLFNVSNHVITASFPSKDQALAGGVFNTVSQLGNSVGPAVTALIASSVTHAEMGKKGVSEPHATLEGYRSAFWTCFALAAVSAAVSAVGLRNAGKVGMKKHM